VRRGKATSGEGIVSVVLDRPSGKVELVRPNGHIGTLSQPGQPDRQVALQRRGISDCLAEELRQLDPDEVYENTLKGLSAVVRGRVAAATPTATKKNSASDKTKSRPGKPAPPADEQPTSTPPSDQQSEHKPVRAASDEKQTATAGT
jgi:hypothetical protein